MNDHPLGPYEHAPTANLPGMRLSANELSLVRRDPPDTSPQAIIEETFALIKSRTNESVGYGVALFALNIGLNGIVQMALQAAITFVFIAGIGLAEINEVAALTVLCGGLSLGTVVLMCCAFTVQATTMGGYQLLWLKMLRNQPMSLDDVKQIRPSIFPLVGASLLSTLGIALGSVALILPGIVLMLGLILHPFFVIDKNLSAVESLKASWIATRGHKKNLLLLVLFMIVANSLGLLACGVGLFISYPLSLGCLATYYNRIATPGNAYLPLDTNLDPSPPAPHHARS